MCDHAEFEADVRVSRLTGPDSPSITGYHADVRIKCVRCGEHFTWLGLPGGSLPDRPTVSVDGRELRAPIAPESEGRSIIDKLAPRH